MTCFFLSGAILHSATGDPPASTSPGSSGWVYVLRNAVLSWDEVPPDLLGYKSGDISYSRTWSDLTGPLGGATEELQQPVPWPDLSQKLSEKFPFPSTKPGDALSGSEIWVTGCASFMRSSGCGARTDDDASLSQARCWYVASETATVDRTVTALHYSSSSAEQPITTVTVTVPAGQLCSNAVDLLPTFSVTPPYVPHTKSDIAPDGAYEFAQEALLPVEVAPDVLRVNSNFDEGRIDSATGYAIPDCDDVDIALEAQRAHLDGKYTQYQRITDDLHPGWFGVNPKLLPKEFWDGGTVTIRKVDKVDDDTGHPESGQVRFYAKRGDDAFQYCAIIPYNLETLAPVNLVQGGINKKPGEGVYGTSSTIPQNAKFYMEGVRPGKITLEWRFQKNGIDARHEQTFLVATKQTKAQWKEEVRYQVRLQTKVATGTAVDIAAYHPGNRFTPNVSNVQAIYYYYRQLFRQMPEKFMWAGMAKVAAAPIYAGMSDATEWYNLTAGFDLYGEGDAGLDFFIKRLLLAGQKQILEDLAWAHRAYYASGIWALMEVQKTETAATDFDAWSILDTAVLDADPQSILEANGRLLRREQRDVVQPNYNDISGIWIKQPKIPLLPLSLQPKWAGVIVVPENAQGLANCGEWLSANSVKNPMTGGPAFRAVVANGRLDVFDQRWNWIWNDTNGMFQLWGGTSSAGPNFTPATRAQRVGLSMRTAAGFSSPIYSFDPDYLPIEAAPPIP